MKSIIDICTELYSSRLEQCIFLAGAAKAVDLIQDAGLHKATLYEANKAGIIAAREIIVAITKWLNEADAGNKAEADAAVTPLPAEKENGQ